MECLGQDDENWGQWVGEHEVPVPREGGRIETREKKLCIVLRGCGSPAEGETVAQAGAIAFETLLEMDPAEQFAQMMAQSNDTPIVGVTVFDDLAEMKRTFCLD